MFWSGRDHGGWTGAGAEDGAEEPDRRMRSSGRNPGLLEPPMEAKLDGEVDWSRRHSSRSSGGGRQMMERAEDGT